MGADLLAERVEKEPGSMTAQMVEAVRAGDHKQLADHLVECKDGDLSATIKLMQKVVADLETRAKNNGTKAGDAEDGEKTDPVPELGEMDYLREDAIDETETNLMLLVPNHAVGWIIGKSGVSISEIQKTSGSNVVVQKEEPLFGFADRPVLISGSIKSNQHAQALVMQRVLEKLQDSSKDGQQNVLKILIPNHTVKWVIGRGGSYIKELEAEAGVRILIESEGEMLPGAAGRHVTITGTLRRCTIAQYLISRKIGAENYGHFAGAYQINPMAYRGQYPYGLVPGGNYPPEYMRGMMGPPLAPSSVGPRYASIEMLVPNNVVARIIGKRGYFIGEVQNQTGANIHVQKEVDMVPGATERKVTLSGPMPAIQSAQMLLQNSIQQWQSEATLAQMGDAQS